MGLNMSIERLIIGRSIVCVIGLLPIDIRYEERSRYYSALSVYDDKAKYSTRKESKTENMAKLIAESELRSINAWLMTFEN